MYRWDRWTGGQIFVAFPLHTTMVTRLTAFIVTYTSTTMSLRWESLSCCHDNTKVILPWLQLRWAVQLMTHCWKENDIILQPVNMCGWDCYVWVAQGSTHKVGERTYSAFSSLFLLCPPPMTAWRSLESAHQRSVPTTRSYLLHWPMEEGNKSEVAMTRTGIATEAGVAWLVKENTSVTTCTTPPLLLQGYTIPITIACSL